MTTYDKIKMKKLVMSNRYLKTMFDDMMETNTNEDLVLRILYKMNIKEYRESYVKIKGK